MEVQSPYSFTQPELIELRVGGEPTTEHQIEDRQPISLFVLASILKKSSIFFRNALNGNFQESSARCIDLPEIHPKSLQMYLRWLHGVDMSYGVDPENLGPIDYDEDPETVEPTVTFKLFQLVILADVLQDSAFHNAIVDIILDRESRTEYTRYNMARFVYENTVDSHPLRRLIIFLIAQQVRFDDPSTTYYLSGERWTRARKTGAQNLSYR